MIHRLLPMTIVLHTFVTHSMRGYIDDSTGHPAVPPMVHQWLTAMLRHPPNCVSRQLLRHLSVTLGLCPHSG